MFDTTTLLIDYLNCRYKALLKLRDEIGEPTAWQEVQSLLKTEYRRLSQDHLSSQHSENEVLRSPASLRVACRSRASLILDVASCDSESRWNFDAIERHGDDRQGDLNPIRFIASQKPSAHDKLLAAADALKLSESQPCAVKDAKLLYGSSFATAKVKSATAKGQSRIAKESRRALNDLELIRSGAVVPKLILNRHCDVCEFRRRCRTEAEKLDDLSLLRGLNPSEIESFNRRGIFTVTQLAYTFRPKSIGRKMGTLKKHSLPLQAMAIRDKTVYVRQKPELPQSKVRVYLDVEGIPERDHYYLIGMLVERTDGYTAFQYWAETATDEERIWNQFLKELSGLDDYAIFHFGRYEREFFDKMESRYGSVAPHDTNNLVPKLVDIHAVIRTNVYFPAYSNGLKDIATQLGAKWNGPVASGLESVAWRLRWERDQQPSVRDALQQYNLEDCVAARIVTHFLIDIAYESPTDRFTVKSTDSLPNQSPSRFGQSPFALPDFGKFTKQAYFTYQRDKVFFRTDKNVRKSASRSRRRLHSKRRISRRIQCSPPSCCSNCGATEIRIYTAKPHTKVVDDLKFTKTGMKRTSVEYATARYECCKCLSTSYSYEYPTGGNRFGNGIACWAAYQQIALGQSGYAVAASLNDVFNFSFNEYVVTAARRRLAKFHEATEKCLLNRLRCGNLICADEAKIAIKGGTGYVWAFSNAEDVIYRFSRSRDGSVLDEVLGDFSGVLVSDFYGVYDSLKCPQQKCVVHLIRDINDDLLKAPFDSELKGIAERFTELLRAIIDAIDRYGLKKRHLQRFLPKAARYLKWMETQVFASKLAQGYQKRFEKYGQRLFTFLSYDGVPWNNNLAENAVKLIASRRRIIGAQFSEAGISDYLRLLSLYQTLRRKGGSFLRFLLSKETDIYRFLGE
ncbi:MAG: TM0106 family RecB-like putative nuclease [Planctomycetia bacterium]|nr:TM0106 family RecB-like putative nuclease [Planctomycetia bacterium]